jgi:transposase InsO family protein
MQVFYSISGISRQGYFQQRARESKEFFQYERIKDMVTEVRKDHPRMGSRPIYYKLKITGIGINKFERYVSSSGLGIEKKCLWIKTTNSNHNLYKYKNLTYGMVLTGINQLWVSDITYWIQDKTYYLIFLQDVYSRRIIGYLASDNMFALNNVRTLKKAFKIRGEQKFQSLVHHSDKGSQYCSNEYIKCLTKANITVSMANNSLENPYAERLNGIIKNDYLTFKQTNTLSKLNIALKDVVHLYNNERPHSELGYLSPVEFEEEILSISEKERIAMKLFDFNK